MVFNLKSMSKSDAENILLHYILFLKMKFNEVISEISDLQIFLIVDVYSRSNNVYSIMN